MENNIKILEIYQKDSIIAIHDVDDFGEIMIKTTDMDESKTTFWLKVEHLKLLKEHIDYLYKKFEAGAKLLDTNFNG